MRRIASWWCWHSPEFVSSCCNWSTSVRHHHHHDAEDGGQHDDIHMDIGQKIHIRPSAPNSLKLNALSTAVRRFIEHSPGRWWETSGGANTLLTILLDRRHSSAEGDGGTLHPFLGVVMLRKFGFAVYMDGVHRHSGWAARCGLAAEDLARLASCVLQPLLPHAKTHPKVRSVLPLIIEWLLCISNIPLYVWLPHLSLYVDDLAILNADNTLCKPLPLDFLMLHLVPKSSLLEAAGAPNEASWGAMGQVLCKILQLLASRQGVRMSGMEADSLNTSPCNGEKFTGDLVHTLFWMGEAPLLLHDAVRAAYKRLHYSTEQADVAASSSEADVAKKRHAPVLTVPIVDDDAFRRLLLRLLCSPPPFVSAQPLKASSHHLVLVEPLLQLEDPSVVLRFIIPLSEFVTVVMEKGLSLPLCLSFRGIQGVIYSAIGELQRLRSTSTQQSVLLPHKPRIHTLQSLSERLLDDAQRHLKHQRQQTQGCEGEGDVSTFFPGTPLQQQLHVLQSFCRATRRLVRAVMEEKAASLLADGPEGSALRAGGAVAAHACVTDALRNTAFRVLETSLLRYYKALDECSLSSPIRNVRDGDYAYDHVRETVAEIEHHAGGRAVLLTAQHLLEHPLLQDVAAVVEGLRLVAMQALVLHSPQCEEWLFSGGYTRTVMAAFFSVWHRTMAGWTESSVREADAVDGSRIALNEAQRRVSERLLWTMLLLHQHYCSSCVGVQMEERIWSDGAINGCGLLRSLLDLLTSRSTCTELAGIGFWPFSPNCKEADSADGEPRIRAHPAFMVRAMRLSAERGSMEGCTTRWELQEELLSLAGGEGGRWHWLGRTGAVLEAASAECAAGCVGYLLPWSTVAHSRHPLRLYDESGQSTDAAFRFDEAVMALLQLQGAPLLRVVGVVEEATLFRNMASTAELSVGLGVIVANPEASRRSIAGLACGDGRHDPRAAATTTTTATVGDGDNDNNDEDDDYLD